MTELLAHTNRKDGKDQTLEEHLYNTSEQMSCYTDGTEFSLTSDIKGLLSDIGKNHDIGKANKWFQQYIRSGEYPNSDSRANHSMISAAIYAMKYWDKAAQWDSFLAAVSIRCHHGELNIDVRKGANFDYLEEQFASIKNNLAHNNLEYLLPEEIDVEQFKKIWGRFRLKKVNKNTSPEPFFLLQYIFSCLISADKLDSAELLEQTSKDGIYGDVESLLTQKRKGKPVDLNSSRDKIRQTVLYNLENLTEEELDKQRIFTITAPTGTGKTLTGLSAAILLADRLEKMGKERPHLISAVPFINILEQAIDDYKSVFGDTLVHYGAADPSEYNKDFNELPLKEQMMMTQAWESPVVLTTFVQLFESILTSKNKRLLKLHRLANSIILLDEVQALQAEYYPLFTAVMDSISRYYGARFILMTATQPKIFDCMSLCNSFDGYIKPTVRELLPDYKNYFENLYRTKFVPKWEIDSIEAVEEEILDAYKQYDSILCVVNRIQDSIDLYESLKYKANVLYLSTNIISVDRKEVIKRAKKYLNSDEHTPFIMISTQTIEAGIDLDFDIAFRDLAPMESIIQVAGRVNRSGLKAEYSPVVLFDTGNWRNVYKGITCNMVKKSISKEIYEYEYQDMLDKYFSYVISTATTFDGNIYKNGILKLDYEKIDSFHMIKKEERASVLVLKDEEAIKLVNSLVELYKKTDKDFNDRACIQRNLAELGAYTVEIYPKRLKENQPPKFEDIYGIPLNFYVTTQNDWERYYSVETGFKAGNQTEAYIY